MKYTLLSIMFFIQFGCIEPNVKETNSEIKLSDTKSIKTYEWEYKGHLYIVAKSREEFGITHAGHCPCNK